MSTAISPPAPPVLPLLPVLALLNGPPGAGKSTLAAALARRHPDTCALDVDVIKHGLDSWPSAPHTAGLHTSAAHTAGLHTSATHTAGLQARAIVLEQAHAMLADGISVVIGQYLARPEFPGQLAELARQVPARHVHVVLELPAAALEQRLSDRRRSPTRPEQAINDAGVVPADAAELIASVEALTGSMAGVVRVDASGDLAQTIARVEEALMKRPC